MSDLLGWVTADEWNAVWESMKKWEQAIRADERKRIADTFYQKADKMEAEWREHIKKPCTAPATTYYTVFRGLGDEILAGGVK